MSTLVQLVFILES